MIAGVLGSVMTNEQWLVSDAQQGDLDAFNQLVLKYQDILYNHARWLVRDAGLAADLTQDAFIIAYRRLDGFRGGSFRAWLLRILNNTCIDELRRQKRRPTLRLEPADADGDEFESPTWIAGRSPSVEAQVEQLELRRTLHNAVQSLPVEFREAVLLIDVLEFDYREAAQTMGVPLGTVKSRVARARRRLQEQLALGGEPWEVENPVWEEAPEKLFWESNQPRNAQVGKLPIPVYG
jgi:RNA polymerase sigma-70 factor (ECF subfamily)